MVVVLLRWAERGVRGEERRGRERGGAEEAGGETLVVEERGAKERERAIRAPRSLVSCRYLN
jgi:hypothetical protein